VHRARSVTVNVPLLDLSGCSDVNFELVYLDQEKVFDRVGHEYMFNVMSVFGFGFGSMFSACVRML
jgi:hypothetical protein